MGGVGEMRHSIEYCFILTFIMTPRLLVVAAAAAASLLCCISAVVH